MRQAIPSLAATLTGLLLPLAAVEAAVSTADLELYYTFEAATVSGTTVTDQWTADGDEDNVARGSLVTFAGGKFGDAIDVSIVNGTPRYGSSDATAINNIFMPGTGDWTLTFWYQQDANAGGNRIWGAGARTAGGNPGGLQLRQIGDGTFAVDYQEPVGGAPLDSFTTTSSAIFDGTTTWYHFVLVRSGDVLALWINGVNTTGDQATLAAGYNIAVDGGVWWREPAFGPDQDTIGNAACDDAAVFHRALSAVEIGEIYNGGAGTPLSNYTVVDTDNDGLPDLWEQQIIDASGGTLTLADIHGPLDTNITSDYDQDGLTDADEFAEGFDPIDDDMDNDGLNDGAEWSVHCTDPLDPDSDDDLLTDGAEVNTHGSDPTLVDSDFDGIADGLEVASDSLPNDINSVPAVLTPFDQTGVTGGGDGITIIDPSSLQAYLGGIADDTLSGTFSYSIDLEFTQLAGGTGLNGFAAVQLWQGGGERLGIGDRWPDTNWSGFNAPGTGNFVLLDSGSNPVALALNDKRTVSVSIEMVASGDDTVTVTFEGSDQAFTGPLDFDQVRVRCGNADQAANFTNMSFRFTVTSNMQLAISPHDSVTDEVTLTVSNVPGGGAQTFHLRSSTDGQVFTPVAGTEFTADAFFFHGPVLGGGNPVVLFQIFDGPIVP